MHRKYGGKTGRERREGKDRERKTGRERQGGKYREGNIEKEIQGRKYSLPGYGISLHTQFSIKTVLERCYS